MVIQAGVFDLFHIGHLNILKQAAKNCDYLIVGVTADETVYEYKSDTQLFPLKERIAIVESIVYTDRGVVVQEEMDKIRAYELYRFDEIISWKWIGKIQKCIMILKKTKLRDKGVEVIYFEYTKGTSTTNLKFKIFNELSENENS